MQPELMDALERRSEKESSIEVLERLLAEKDTLLAERGIAGSFSGRIVSV